MAPVAPLGVGDGLLEGQPGAVLNRPFQAVVAQRGAGRGQVQHRCLPEHRECHEAKRRPLPLGRGDEPDGALVLPGADGDLGDHVEGVDHRETPAVVDEHLERVVGDGFRPLVVAFEQQGAGQPEVGECLGPAVPQWLGGGQQPFDVDLGRGAGPG